MSNQIILAVRRLAGLVAAASLVACANPGAGPEHEQHHARQSANAPGVGASGSSATQGGTAGGAMMGSHADCAMRDTGTGGCAGGMRHTDKEAMCAQYRGMRDAPNEQARQAMMDGQMRNMSPEMRLRHMEIMRRHCE